LRSISLQAPHRRAPSPPTRLVSLALRAPAAGLENFVRRHVESLRLSRVSALPGLLESFQPKMTRRGASRRSPRSLTAARQSPLQGERRRANRGLRRRLGDNRFNSRRPFRTMLDRFRKGGLFAA